MPDLQRPMKSKTAFNALYLDYWQTNLQTLSGTTSDPYLRQTTADIFSTTPYYSPYMEMAEVAQGTIPLRHILVTRCWLLPGTMAAVISYANWSYDRSHLHEDNNNMLFRMLFEVNHEPRRH